MSYEASLEKIHSLLTFGSRPGLDRMKALLDRLGNPQDKLKFVHVAGTNGKGSVCAMLSSVLVAAGYKTGLFISPYIIDFRERIQINNRMISRETLEKAVDETYPVLMKLRDEGVVITEFEYVNALEFYIHAQEKCDVVVLETGMGGTLDCTNVIKPPLCSVITVIGLDHTAVLGDTIEQIASQKAGIIKTGSFAVSSRQESPAMAVIENTAREKNVPLIKSGSVKINGLQSCLSGSSFEALGIKIKLNLSGAHQVENAKTALAALEYMRKNGLLKISDDDISSGFANAKNPARLELMGTNPTVLIDGAHNPNGARALANAVKEFLPEKKIFCVTGMLADKDVGSVIGILAPMFERVFTVSVDNPRTMSAGELARRYREAGADAVSRGDKTEAVNNALALAKAENGVLLICGSLYLAASLRPLFIS
ncbi:MAG TPA: bifunctional folylpolyglutamate synthase/dihydrofolate synthase [Ruminococcaceae bacterium]|nr:bifunctional folylpolyglutamate synthase/dihydrofolate synthase [Oscillospiraceae bacterium]